MIHRKRFLPLPFFALVVLGTAPMACGEDESSPAGTPTAGAAGTGASAAGASNGGKAGSGTSAGAAGATNGGAAGTAAGSTSSAGAAGTTSGGSTAGGSDAGGSDAGGSDAGGSDAGGSDAGGSDAGGSDAGGSDAGGGKAGAGAAGKAGAAGAAGKAGAAGAAGKAGAAGAAGKAGAAGAAGGAGTAGAAGAPSNGTDDPLASLPPDSGGKHTPYPLGTTEAKHGYYLYTPGGYEASTKSYPLLVFLHGKGERGNGTTDLINVTKNGVPKLIQAKKWATSYPMLVVSPQYEPVDGKGVDNSWGDGNPVALKAFIEYMMSHYRVNGARIYATGLSHGGNGLYDYLVQQDDATSHLAAAAVVAAYGPTKNYAKSNNTPIWVFVGSADGGNFPSSEKYVKGYNAQQPPPEFKALFSVYAGAGHDVWTRTYDLSGMGKVDPAYDPYDVSVFDWMFQYKRKD